MTVASSQGGGGGDAPKTPPSVDQERGSEMTRPPAGGSEKVGAAYNPGTVRTGGNMVIGIIALVVAAVLLALLLFFFLS